MIFFVERLTLRVWCQSILPHFLRARRHSGRGRLRCYVFDGSRLALAVARASTWMTGVVVEPLRFRLLDVRDEQGLLIRSKIAHQDLAEVQADIMEGPAFQEAIRARQSRGRLPMYLAKALITADTRKRQTFCWRALLTIQVCVWKMRQEGLRIPPAPPLAESTNGMPQQTRQTETVAVYFLEQRPWLATIVRYAARYGLSVVPIGPSVQLRAWMSDHLTPGMMEWLRDLRSRWLSARLWLGSLLTGRVVSSGARREGDAQAATKARVAVDYYGHFNLAHPERHSELFFWQQSSLSAPQIVVFFSVCYDPLDGPKWAELTRHGLAAIALEPQATTVLGAPVFFRHHRGRTAETWIARGVLTDGSVEARWLREHLRRYATLRAYWADLFASQQVKVYLSWYKFTETHCAIADALQRVGGVTAIYQRSYESHPSAESAVAADIVFGFSQAAAELERRSGSVIPYFVTTGYLGDHRFPLLRRHAQAIRDALQRRGARRILAYADENSHDEERWSLGHGMTREHYAFLLEKVLAEPWLGVVIKPKVPATLRRRLGPVAALLGRAEATGRCLVFEEPTLRGSYPPAVAALAADVMIHGHLIAATAGAESALAGVPTLLLDREGWSVSPFYRLGIGRVVFTDWERLWKTCLDHWNRPGGVPGFGDWSSMLDELDPFRDGRAAKRLGTYLQWLLDGFDAGLDRETVMADAAQRYADRWGKDKILRVSAGPLEASPTRETSGPSFATMESLSV